MHMILVARALERIGDNAVDIGEQVVFVVTGLFSEFSTPRTPSAVRSRRRRPPAEAPAKRGDFTPTSVKIL